MRRFARLPYNFCSSRCIHFSHPRWGTVIPYKLADIGEGITQVEVVTVHVKPGDRVEEFDKICEVQSDKAMVDITSRYRGVITSVHVAVGQTALVGRPLVDIELQDDAKEAAPDGDGTARAGSGDHAAEKDTAPTKRDDDNGTASARTTAASLSFPSSVAATGAKKPLATPATRAFARECGVDLSTVKGTGADGRVLKKDVGAHAESRGGDAGDVVVSLLTGIRRVMVSSMTEAGSIPSFTACDEVEITALLKFRDQLKDMMVSCRNGDASQKVSFLPCFLKAASLALLQHPEINAHTSRKCESLILRSAHNIGFAVDSPKGLIVPVVRNVERKNILDLVQEVNELVAMGRKNQIPPDRMRDGTFTISNVGTIGATYATPMLFPPQVAICAVGRLQVLPRFDAEGNVFKANIVSISSTADHRVIDGATLVRFNNTFKKMLESPQLMLSETEKSV